MDVTLGNTREKLYLGGDAYSAPMVYIRDNNASWVLYDIVRDYQGSITHLVDNSDGTVVAEYSYDPWGRLRDPETLAVYTPGSASSPTLLLGRGYTAHEHLDWFGLINMNARLYDPALGRFLSPDPYVQAPDFTQNFNRYSYCLNNPLKYKDESGEVYFRFIFNINKKGITIGLRLSFDFGLVIGGGIQFGFDYVDNKGKNHSGSLGFYLEAGIGFDLPFIEYTVMSKYSYSWTPAEGKQNNDFSLSITAKVGLVKASSSYSFTSKNLSAKLDVQIPGLPDYFAVSAGLTFDHINKPEATTITLRQEHNNSASLSIDPSHLTKATSSNHTKSSSKKDDSLKAKHLQLYSHKEVHHNDNLICIRMP